MIHGVGWVTKVLGWFPSLTRGRVWSNVLGVNGCGGSAAVGKVLNLKVLLIFGMN